MNELEDHYSVSKITALVKPYRKLTGATTIPGF
jgi:hypothetical protein